VRVIGHVKRSRALRRVAREIFFQRKYERKKKKKRKERKMEKNGYRKAGKGRKKE